MLHPEIGQPTHAPAAGSLSQLLPYDQRSAFHPRKRRVLLAHLTPYGEALSGAKACRCHIGTIQARMAPGDKRIPVAPDMRTHHQELGIPRVFT